MCHPPILDLALHRESVLARIGIVHGDLHQSSADSADGFEAHATRAVEVVVLEQRQESAAALPVTLAERLAIDLRPNLHAPFGARRLEDGEWRIPEIFVRPRHCQQSGRDIEQCLLTRLRARHGHPMRWRKRISEIHPLGLFRALSLGGHCAQRTCKEELASVHGKKS